jgi:hypothetical protein
VKGIGYALIEILCQDGLRDSENPQKAVGIKAVPPEIRTVPLPNIKSPDPSGSDPCFRN